MAFVLLRRPPRFMLVEAFLIVDQPRQRLSHWSQSLAPLDGAARTTVTAYYDPATDQALLALRYDDDLLGKDRLGYIVELARLMEIGMIQPAELSVGDRRRFLGERLARCTIHIDDQRSVVGALTELVRRVRQQRTKAARATLDPRGVDDPALAVAPRSTRDDMPAIRSTRDEVRPPPRTTSPHVIPRPAPEHRTETVQLTAIEIQSMLEAARGTEELPPPGDEDELPPAVVAPLPADQHLPPGIIYARFLRGGRWVPVRIGALSLKGATLMSSTMPRAQDRVDIALAYAGHRALVRGLVTKVSTNEEAALSGTPTFSAAFDLDLTARRHLTELLTAARAARVTIKVPPPRHARRYPVEWPVCLGTMRGAVRGEALDVSRDGMFVRPTNALTLDVSLSFSAVLDDGGEPISGRAKVVRHIDGDKAQDLGLVPGYGLHIVDMARLDYERWHDFLARIEKRANKCVLVGASSARLGELQAGLAAAGYAVTGGTDPHAIAQLATAEARPFDACLLDAGWLSTAVWIEEVFAAARVPCITMRGDVKRVRAAIDRLLAIT